MAGRRGCTGGPTAEEEVTMRWVLAVLFALVVLASCESKDIVRPAPQPASPADTTVVEDDDDDDEEEDD